MNGAVKVLRKARSWVRKGWAQHQDAVNKHGDAVPPSSPNAVRFCAWGALERAGDGMPYKVRPEVCEPLMQAIKRMTRGRTDGICTYNDAKRRTKEQVVKAFTLAIELAKAEDTQ